MSNLPEAILNRLYEVKRYAAGPDATKEGWARQLASCLIVGIYFRDDDAPMKQERERRANIREAIKAAVKESKL